MPVNEEVLRLPRYGRDLVIAPRETLVSAPRVQKFFADLSGNGFGMQPVDERRLVSCLRLSERAPRQRQYGRRGRKKRRARPARHGRSIASNDSSIAESVSSMSASV